MRSKLDLKFVALTALIFTMFMLLPIAQVQAADPANPPYQQIDQEYSNGCYYPLFGEYCITASISTGQADQYSSAYPAQCAGVCSGGVNFHTYVYFDDNGPPNGASLYFSQGSTLWFELTTRFNGYVYADPDSVAGNTATAVFANEMYLYKPDGSHTTYVWDVALLDNGASGTTYATSCDNGQPNVWCIYGWSLSAPETGTYYLGGGFGTGAGASYNQDGAASATTQFGQSGGTDYATVGGFKLSTSF